MWEVSGASFTDELILAATKIWMYEDDVKDGDSDHIMSADKSYGYHTVLDEEQAAFADWINDTLSHDQVYHHHHPSSFP